MLQKHFMMHLNKHQHTWLESSIQKKINLKKKTNIAYFFRSVTHALKVKKNNTSISLFLHLQLHLNSKLGICYTNIS